MPKTPLNRWGPLYMGEERSQEWLCHEHKKQEQRHSCRRYIAGKLAAGLLRSKRRPEQVGASAHGRRAQPGTAVPQERKNKSSGICAAAA